MKKSYIVFRVIGYILLALQVVSLIGGMLAAGPRFYGYFYLELITRLFFIDGVPGFFYTIGRLMPLILAIVFFGIGKKLKKKYMIWEAAELAKDPNVPSWVCVLCNTVNLETADDCIKCGSAKAYTKKKMAEQQEKQ